MSKKELIMIYAEHLVDSMDTDSLQQFVFECLFDKLFNYSDSELNEEIKEYAPHLLDN
jgi:hypothetical protein